MRSRASWGMGDFADLADLAATAIADADLDELYAREDELPDSEAMLVTVYDFLTWLQESLTQALVGEAPE